MLLNMAIFLWRYIFLLANFFFVAKNQTYQESNIVCIPLKQCPLLYNLIKKGPTKPEYIELLRTSHCGYENKEPKVWCPLDNGRCVTPQGNISTCQKIDNCPSYLDAIFKYPADVLKKFDCNDGKVCCPPNDDLLITQNIKPTTDRIATVTTTNMITRMKMTRLPPVSTTLKNMDNITSLLPNPYNKECGKQIYEDRISGGNTTSIDEFPWVVLLGFKDNKGKFKTSCTGTLISDRYVLTAAHCFERRDLKIFNVILGEYNTNTDPDCIVQGFDEEECAPPIQKIRVERVIPHPKWVAAEPQFYHDIALIKLKHKVTFSDYVKPICLPFGEIETNENFMFTVSGWGKTEKDLRSSIKLKAELLMADKNICKNVYKKNIIDEQLCVGKEKFIDTCRGDSGGPLMYPMIINKDILWFQAGIVSIGYNNPCGVYPAIYTYIPPYLDWIYKNIET